VEFYGVPFSIQTRQEPWFQDAGSLSTAKTMPL
jgi:hypothetical protein